MLWSLCLHFHSTHHVCLQAVKITPSPALCVVLCTVCECFLGPWGWAIFHETPQLLLVHTSKLDTTAMVSHLFPLCWPYLYRVCGISVVLHGVVTGWAVRQGLFCLSHEIIFYNFHERIREAKFITRDLQWNILLPFGTMEETAVTETNWIWTNKKMSHILHWCSSYLWMIRF